MAGAATRMCPLAVMLAAVFGAAGCGDAGQTVSPDGAPYSYTVPDGFRKGVAKGGSGVRYPSGVGLDDTSVVLVSTFDAGDVNADNLSSLTRSIDRDFRRTTGRQARSIAGPIETEVAGHPALRWNLSGYRTERGELTDGEVYSVFARSTALTVACRWKPDKRVQLQRGCANVRSTLELR